MLRHMFTGICAVSLALCIIVAVLWVRSAGEGDRLMDVTVLDRGKWDLRSNGGWLTVADSQRRVEGEEGLRSLRALGSRLNDRRDNVLPQGLGSSESPQERRQRLQRQLAELEAIEQERQAIAMKLSNARAYPVYRVRHVWILAGTLVLPFVWMVVQLVAWRKRRRRRRWGLCLGCGYDLRASYGRCPECGLATTNGAQGAAAVTDLRASG